MPVNNPYAELVKMMREHGSKYNPPAIHLAEVLEPPPEIIIKLGDIQIDKKNILIADYLLKEYKREYKATGKLKFEDANCGKTTPQVVGNHGSHTHGIASLNVNTEDFPDSFVIEGKDPYYLWFKDTLKKGDVLAVMPTYDMQTYIILARVVRPDE